MIARRSKTLPDLAVTATGSCERGITPGRTTVWTALLASVALAACGRGGHGGDTYAKGTHAEEACCEHLQGAGRDGCLQQIVRVDDGQVAGSSVNQSTYACVVDHFTCDPATGHATQASAQAQLECIQDLQASAR
jgi:hypothetical protein